MRKSVNGRGHLHRILITCNGNTSRNVKYSSQIKIEGINSIVGTLLTSRF